MHTKIFFLVMASAALTSPKLSVERITFGPVEVSLGETTFEQIAKRVGPARIEHTGRVQLGVIGLGQIGRASCRERV